MVVGQCAVNDDYPAEESATDGTAVAGARVAVLQGETLNLRALRFVQLEMFRRVAATQRDQALAVDGRIDRDVLHAG